MFRPEDKQTFAHLLRGTHGLWQPINIEVHTLWVSFEMLECIWVAFDVFERTEFLVFFCTSVTNDY